MIPPPQPKDMHISNLNMFLYVRNHLRSNTILGLQTLIAQLGMYSPFPKLKSMPQLTCKFIMCILKMESRYKGVSLYNSI